MNILFLILIIIVCGTISFFVLIQNPKGGGLAGNMGGIGNQMMGVKQSTDVVEKGTWIAASALLGLCLLSFVFIGKPTNKKEVIQSKEALKGAPTKSPANKNVPPPSVPLPSSQPTPVPNQ